MTDSSETQDNKSQGEKKHPPAPHGISNPSVDSTACETKSEVITEKFLTVAKEKSYLESIIMSQSDMIKGLEEEKENLTLSLRKFTASHKRMKEKLLDFDMLRNMEIAELKEKIEHLISDNKKLIAEKDSIFRNLERDQKNISRIDNQAVESLMREKRELEERLRETLGDAGTEDEQATQASLDSHKASLASLFKTVEDLEKSIATGELDLEETRDSLKTAADHMQTLERELSLARSQIAETELDRDEARAELYNGRVEIEHLKADRVHVEENLQQKVHDYSQEIAGLKTDIDELTSAIESKIHFIDELTTKVNRLSGELNHKDSELHEKIPALLGKIDSLSQSIDMKMEENSLFAKELFDLNVKISTLNEEMIEKDELLIDISEDYKKQKDEIEALHGAHELTLKNLVYERDLLKNENEDLRSISAIPLQQRNNEQQEKKILEDRLSETLNAIDELGCKNAELAAILSEKDLVISDLQRDVLQMGSRVEGAAAEHAAKLAALQERIVLSNQQLLEKNELLTVMASEREHDKDESLYQIDLLRREKVELDEEMNRLIARGMDQEKNLSEHISLLDTSRQEKAGLEEDLAQAAEKINELVLELDRLTSAGAQKEQSLSAAAAEISVLQANVAALQISQVALEKKIQEKHEISGLANAEKEELHKTALEYQETFEHLKQEIISLNKNLAEKEQTIDLLLSEKDSLAGNISDQQEKLDQSLASIRNLQVQLNESMRDNNSVSAEHSDLSNTIARLQGEINSLNREREEEVKALKDDLLSYGTAVTDLRLKLEQGLNENSELRSKLQASQSAGQEAQAPVIEKREETLPARVEIKSSAGKRSLAYTVVALLLLGGIGFSFYAFNTGLITTFMHKPAVREEVKKELAYNDMFSMLTKISVSDDLKFQATLLTESFVLKSDTPGEKSLFDFQNYIYFKVNISAPKEGLDVETVDNPYPMITLTAGADTVKPLSQIHVKDIKTFYRKEEPVSVMFYCAFPKTLLTPDTNALSLSFNNKKSKAGLAWELKSLRASSLFP